MTSDSSLEAQIVGALRGRELIEVSVGFGIRFVFQDPDGRITVECPSTLTMGNSTFHIDEEADPASAAELVQLVRTKVSAAEILSGALRIEFELRDAVLDVPVNHDFEAWGWTGRDGSRVICMPGGELAVWQANHSSS